MSEKERIDVLMHENGIAESREKAKRLVMAGNVYIDNIRVDKPGTKVDINSIIELKGIMSKYVGRGGYKLEKALKYLKFSGTLVSFPPLLSKLKKRFLK